MINKRGAHFTSYMLQNEVSPIIETQSCDSGFSSLPDEDETSGSGKTSRSSPTYEQSIEHEITHLNPSPTKHLEAVQQQTWQRNLYALQCQHQAQKNLFNLLLWLCSLFINLLVFISLTNLAPLCGTMIIIFVSQLLWLCAALPSTSWFTKKFAVVISDHIAAQAPQEEPSNNQLRKILYLQDEVAALKEQMIEAILKGNAENAKLTNTLDMRDAEVSEWKAKMVDETMQHLSMQAQLQSQLEGETETNKTYGEKITQLKTELQEKHDRNCTEDQNFVNKPAIVAPLPSPSPLPSCKMELKSKNFPKSDNHSAVTDYVITLKHYVSHLPIWGYNDATIAQELYQAIIHSKYASPFLHHYDKRVPKDTTPSSNVILEVLSNVNYENLHFNKEERFRAICKVEGEPNCAFMQRVEQGFDSIFTNPPNDAETRFLRIKGQFIKGGRFPGPLREKLLPFSNMKELIFCAEAQAGDTMLQPIGDGGGIDEGHHHTADESAPAIGDDGSKGIGSQFMESHAVNHSIKQQQWHPHQQKHLWQQHPQQRKNLHQHHLQHQRHLQQQQLKQQHSRQQHQHPQQQQLPLQQQGPQWANRMSQRQRKRKAIQREWQEWETHRGPGPYSLVHPSIPPSSHPLSQRQQQRQQHQQPLAQLPPAPSTVQQRELSAALSGKRYHTKRRHAYQAVSKAWQAEQEARLLLEAASKTLVEKVMTWHGKQGKSPGVWSPTEIMEATAAEEAQEEAQLAFEAASRTLMVKRKVLWGVEQKHLAGSLSGRAVGGV